MRRFVLAAALLLCAVGGAQAAPAARDDSLRVMTFNLMYEPARAGGGLAKRWPLIVELLRESDADLIAFQEVMPGRIEPLHQALPGYGLVVSESSVPGGRKRGASPFVIAIILASSLALAALVYAFRRRGRWVLFAGAGVLIVAAGALAASRLLFVGSIRSQAELLVIAYRPDRLDLEDSQTFWLSDTPTKPGSYGPFDTGPHIALVADFRRIPGEGEPLRVVNTHVGHSPLERSRGARILRRWLDPRSDEVPQVLIGDMNATPDNPLIKKLREETPEALGFRDAWLEAAKRSGPATTYHWSRPARDFLPLRIDYVMVRGPIEVGEAQVIGKARDGVVASDHDALVVELMVR